MEIIQDGKGRGYRAGVTDTGNLETTAIVDTRAAYNSRSRKNVYEFHPPVMDLYTAAGFMPLVWMKNISSDKPWYMDLIRFTFNGGNTTKTADCRYVTYLGMGEPTSGAVTGMFGIADGPHNLNLASSKAADIDFRYWDRVGTSGMVLTDNYLGKQLNCGFVAKETITLEYRGALIIPPGYIMGFALNTTEDGKGGVVIRGWQDDDFNH